MKVVSRMAWIFLLFLVTSKYSFSQEIGQSKSAILAKLAKSTFKIIKNTDEKVIGEFPEPKMYYEYYFNNNICYKQEGLIPLTEKDYYVETLKKNGWVKIKDEDGRTEIYKKAGYIQKVISLDAGGVGYFKFKIDKV